MLGIFGYLKIFNEAGNSFNYWYILIFAVAYFVIWACVPLAEGLQRRGRIRMFEDISHKYGLKHEFTKLRYLNSYGEFNKLSGTYKNHSVLIRDVHDKPKAWHGATSQIPIKGVALSFGPQKTLYAIDGEEKRFPQELNNLKQIFDPKSGYASKEQIVTALEGSAFLS